MFFKAAGTEELDAFYPIRPECVANVPKTRFRPRAGKTLSARRWQAAFSGDGHLDMAKVLRRIQRGGIHPSIKGVVWEFLLGCFNPESSFDDRNQLRQERRERYETWKTECQNMVPVIGSGKFITTPIITDDGQPIEVEGVPVISSVPDKKAAQWMLLLHQIGLDVVRTDPALAFYEIETNQAKLWDILAVYSWMDNDIGYMQGMNDICSPMVILFENEADAFWCFERAMRRLRDNFRSDTTSIGVQSQLVTLSHVIKTVDPKLHQHLEELDGGEYLFAFRMLMVLFRREFSFIDSLYLWEVINLCFSIAIWANAIVIVVLVRLEFESLRHRSASIPQVMWAMEYNPHIFLSYEAGDSSSDTNTAVTSDQKVLKQCGKFERMNMQNGWSDKNGALSVFLIAGVLETKNKQILKEAKGIDDIVSVLTRSLPLVYAKFHTLTPRITD
ncbi:hypothetical protein V6N12_014180 [Hibiscus sabdariffa]|uniref:Rab-GAP TBC domain-containing protein n=1 Tax=Hibiscus sabdariffa TaxID=183260 RepID=A0ABR2DM99_9ROSI